MLDTDSVVVPYELAEIESYQLVEAVSTQIPRWLHARLCASYLSTMCSMAAEAAPSQLDYFMDAPAGYPRLRLSIYRP